MLGSLLSLTVATSTTPVVLLEPENVSNVAPKVVDRLTRSLEHRLARAGAAKVIPWSVWERTRPAQLSGCKGFECAAAQTNDYVLWRILALERECVLIAERLESRPFAVTRAAVWVGGCVESQLLAGIDALATGLRAEQALGPVAALAALSGPVQSPELDRLLADYLRAKLVASRFAVLPPDPAARARGACGLDCQLQAGAAMAASVSIAPQFLAVGGECVLSIIVYDLRTATSVGGADAKGSCSPRGQLDLIDEATTALGGKPPRPRWVGRPSAASSLEELKRQTWTCIKRLCSRVPCDLGLAFSEAAAGGSFEQIDRVRQRCLAEQNRVSP